MRQRSKTNSRKWENKELVEEYLKANQYDELFPLLLECGFTVPAYQPANRNKYEPHHLFGNLGQRWDLVSNIVSVSPATHDWCHNHTEQSDWRIVALEIKRRKKELSLEDFKLVTGKHLGGWLDIHQPVQDGVRVLWEELKSYVEQHNEQEN